jgi:hypothetical protein
MKTYDVRFRTDQVWSLRVKAKDEVAARHQVNELLDTGEDPTEYGAEIEDQDNAVDWVELVADNEGGAV